MLSVVNPLYIPTQDSQAFLFLRRVFIVVLSNCRSLLYFSENPERTEGKLTWRRHDLADLFLRQLLCASALLLTNYFFPSCHNNRGVYPTVRKTNLTVSSTLLMTNSPTGKWCSMSTLLLPPPSEEKGGGAGKRLNILAAPHAAQTLEALLRVHLAPFRCPGLIVSSAEIA